MLGIVAVYFLESVPFERQGKVPKSSEENCV
jgi:hypothetical protein